MFRKMVAATAVLTIVAVLGAASPAAAAKPIERFKIVEEFSYDDPLAAAGCGIRQMDVHESIRVTVNLFEDGSARVHEKINVTLSNPDTGDTVRIQQARKVNDRPVSSTLEEGVVTEVFELAYTGLAEKWTIPGEGVIARDAGQLRLTIAVSFDAETGDFLGFDEQVQDVKGPHPIWFDGPPFDEVCRGLGGELAV